MRVERYDGTLIRQVLIGMIVSRKVLGPIADRWDPKGLFSTPWANLIAGWCVQHWRENRKAPGLVIQTYFARWAQSTPDRDTLGIVEDLLAGLSDEHERLRTHTNPGYVLERAGELFDKVKIGKTLEDAQADLEEGDVQSARSRLSEFRPVQVGHETGLEFPEDLNAFESAFDRTAGVSLIEYPGALGKFFGHMLGRQQFVAFWGREKVGKSFWGLDVVWEAFRQGNNVAYIVTGDMSRDQVMNRLGSRAAGRPVRDEYCKIPTDLTGAERRGDRPRVDYREHAEGSWGGPLEGREATDAFAKALDSRCGRFLLSCHPGGTLTTGGMESEIDAWCQRRGVAPDVIVVDYADLLAPTDPRKDKRDQINETWLALSALRLKLDCLVVALSQADADSYKKTLLEMDNFSDSKTKLAHPTGVVGINRTEEDKEDGLYRLNWVVGRDIPLTAKDFVWTAGCLATAEPAMFSTF